MNLTTQVTIALATIVYLAAVAYGAAVCIPDATFCFIDPCLLANCDEVCRSCGCDAECL
ncbi:hypothetical protein Btru_031745 [Bulinus truncatus]|nr:hypothetical protein Btru_031745 [Bulinus truncatus]